MNTTKVLATACVATLLLCSCDGKKKEVETFATNFARNVEDGDIEALKSVYPQIEEADSIALEFNPDSLKVDKTDKENVYSIYYGNGVSATVSMKDDGSMEVTETKGIFAYPDAKEEFAKNIGALKGDLTDSDKAKRMTLVDFIAEDIYHNYSEKRKHAIVNKGATITKDIMFMMDAGSGYYTLMNTTDEPIKGDEYTITWEDIYLAAMVDETNHRVETGKDIPAHGTVKIPFQFSGHSQSSITKITMKELSNEEFMKTYTPKGNEYKEYVNEHGDDVTKGSSKLGDGPYMIQGKLGGKYAVHINLEKGMKSGSYYYDKNGPDATLELKVQEFNPKTGKLVLEEHNNKGQVTGTFNGTLSATNYIGQMTSFQNKVYDFDMTVTR